MNLHDWFYLVAIIFMAVLLILMVSIGLIFFLIYQQVTLLQKQVSHKVASLVEPAEIAINAGNMAAKNAVSKVRNFLGKKKS